MNKRPHTIQLTYFLDSIVTYDGTTLELVVVIFTFIFIGSVFISQFIFFVLKRLLIILILDIRFVRAK